MNRLFGGGKNKGPSATNLQAQKSKQVESLKKVGAIEILRDVEYRVVLSQPSSSTNLTIIINLPVQFPSEMPVLSVQPAVSHPWVDGQMKVVGCQAINNFSMHSDLGQAVHAVLDEFKRSPPAVVPQHYILGVNTPTIGSSYASSPPTAALPGYPPNYASQPSGAPGRPPIIPPPLPPRRVASGAGGESGPEQGAVPFNPPNIMAEFPALKTMKISELSELCEDEDKILEMAQKIPDLGYFSQHRESLSTSCVQLAQSNLAMKPQIESLKEEVSTKKTELEQIRQELENSSSRHATMSEQMHPTNIQTNLKVAVLEADEASEKMADSFLNKELDVDSFLKAYMEKRTMCYLRRAKEEKLNQIIMSQGLHF